MKDMKGSNKTNLDLVAIWDSLATTIQKDTAMKYRQIQKSKFCLQLFTNLMPAEFSQIGIGFNIPQLVFVNASPSPQNDELHRVRDGLKTS